MAFAIIGHHYWDRPGGGQLVCASAAYSFEKMGYEPILTSTTNFRAEKYSEWFGIDLTKYKKYSWNMNLKMFGLYLRFVISRPIIKALKKFNGEIVFTDESTYKPLIKEKKKTKFKLIEYMHFPYEVSVDPRFKNTGLNYGEDPYIVERYGRFPMNIYWKVYVSLLPYFLRKNPFQSADLVLTNSNWTAELAKQIYGEKPYVLNPPIPPNVEIVNNIKPFEERENAVVMLGRFSEEKRYHWVITEVMPKLLKEVPDAKLYIFGGAGTRTSKMYIERLKNLIANAKLDKNVFLIPDAPRSQINETMDKSRAFLHATINEHWGIVVAEALARRLPVVVHKSGGAWSDIAEEGKYGLGYESAEEAVEKVSKLLTDSKFWYSFSSTERVKELTLDAFVQKFSALIKRIT
ncbi:MAG: glycosyltransferase [Nitrososphaeria archaeon]